MKFEWDEAKNLSNQRKHGVSFEKRSMCSRIHYTSLYEDRVDEYGEQRWQLIGLISAEILLLVIHVVREAGGGSELSASSQQGMQPGRKGDFMKSKMVSYTLETLPPISQERLEEMKKMANRPDSEIDTSDIPECTEAQFKNAKRGLFYRPIKRQITARVDADVLAWLKSQGRGYQSRINAILRREMLQASKQR